MCTTTFVPFSCVIFFCIFISEGAPPHGLRLYELIVCVSTTSTLSTMPQQQNFESQLSHKRNHLLTWKRHKLSVEASKKKNVCLAFLRARRARWLASKNEFFPPDRVFLASWSVRKNLMRFFAGVLVSCFIFISYTLRLVDVFSLLALDRLPARKLHNYNANLTFCSLVFRFCFLRVARLRWFFSRVLFFSLAALRVFGLSSFGVLCCLLVFHSRTLLFLVFRL